MVVVDVVLDASGWLDEEEKESSKQARRQAGRQKKKKKKARNNSNIVKNFEIAFLFLSFIIIIWRCRFLFVVVVVVVFRSFVRPLLWFVEPRGWTICAKSGVYTLSIHRC